MVDAAAERYARLRRLVVPTGVRWVVPPQNRQGNQQNPYYFYDNSSNDENGVVNDHVPFDGFLSYLWRLVWCAVVTAGVLVAAGTTYGAMYYWFVHLPAQMATSQLQFDYTTTLASTTTGLVGMEEEHCWRDPCCDHYQRLQKQQELSSTLPSSLAFSTSPKACVSLLPPLPKNADGSDADNAAKSRALLQAGQSYFVEVALELPSSAANLNAGMFAVVVELYGGESNSRRRRGDEGRNSAGEKNMSTTNDSNSDDKSTDTHTEEEATRASTTRSDTEENHQESCDTAALNNVSSSTNNNRDPTAQSHPSSTQYHYQHQPPNHHPRHPDSDNGKDGDEYSYRRMLVSRSQRSARFPHQSPWIAEVRKLCLLVPLLLGAMEESRTVVVPVLRHFELFHGAKNNTGSDNSGDSSSNGDTYTFLTHAVVRVLGQSLPAQPPQPQPSITNTNTASSPASSSTSTAANALTSTAAAPNSNRIVELLGGELRFGRELNPWQHLLREWFVTGFVLGTLVVLAVYAVLWSSVRALFLLLCGSVRQQRSGYRDGGDKEGRQMEEPPCDLDLNSELEFSYADNGHGGFNSNADFFDDDDDLFYEIPPEEATERHPCNNSTVGLAHCDSNDAVNLSTTDAATEQEQAPPSRPHPRTQPQQTAVRGQSRAANDSQPSTSAVVGDNDASDVIFRSSSDHDKVEDSDFSWLDHETQPQPPNCHPRGIQLQQPEPCMSSKHTELPTGTFGRKSGRHEATAATIQQPLLDHPLHDRPSPPSSSSCSKEAEVTPPPSFECESFADEGEGTDMNDTDEIQQCQILTGWWKRAKTTGAPIGMHSHSNLLAESICNRATQHRGSPNRTLWWSQAGVKEYLGSLTD